MPFMISKFMPSFKTLAIVAVVALAVFLGWYFVNTIKDSGKLEEQNKQLVESTKKVTKEIEVTKDLGDVSSKSVVDVVKNEQKTNDLEIDTTAKIDEVLNNVDRKEVDLAKVIPNDTTITDTTNELTITKPDEKIVSKTKTITTNVKGGSNAQEVKSSTNMVISNSKDVNKKKAYYDIDTKTKLALWNIMNDTHKELEFEGDF